MADLTANEGELLTVAFSLHSNPGAYALLLGAGVSAPSGILTAWGVLEDLVARSADLVGADPDDPLAWYEEFFGSEPTYEGVDGTRATPAIAHGAATEHRQNPAVLQRKSQLSVASKEGKAMLAISAAFAELEHESSERQLGGIAVTKAGGEYVRDGVPRAVIARHLGVSRQTLHTAPKRERKYAGYARIT